MTDLERKLISRLLDLASGEFANHGSNDFDLILDGNLTEGEARLVQESLFRDGVVDEVSTGPGHYTQDWLLMAWLSKKVLGS